MLPPLFQRDDQIDYKIENVESFRYDEEGDSWDLMPLELPLSMQFYADTFITDICD